MKTLRIINQNLPGTEQRKNISLEGYDYEVVMKVNTAVTGADNLFEFDMKQHFDDIGATPGTRDETIIGFVHGKNKRHPIRDFESAYIVDENGKTFERIYGMYQKY